MSKEKKGFLKGLFSRKSDCCSFEIEENDNQNNNENQGDVKEETKAEKNDNSSECCSDLNACDIRCSPKYKEKNSGCKPGGGCC